jgi:hypothetical protein
MTSACGEANKLLAMVCQVSSNQIPVGGRIFLTPVETMVLLYLCNNSFAAACRSEGIGYDSQSYAILGSRLRNTT